jgi:hypothetical protein
MANRKLAIPFRLTDIETSQWAVNPENYSEDIFDLQLAFNSTFSINLEHHIIECIPKIMLSQNEQEFLVIETSFSFMVEEKAWETMIKGKDLIVPKKLKEHFLVIAIGTLRGIIFEKTNSKNVKLNKLVLPTIDVRNGTGDDLVFHLSEE